MGGPNTGGRLQKKYIPAKLVSLFFVDRSNYIAGVSKNGGSLVMELGSGSGSG